MKTNLPTQDAESYAFSFFDATDFGPIATYSDGSISSTAKINSSEIFLDGILAAIKWIFLYIPGAAGVHFLMMGLGLMFHYQNLAGEMQMIGGLTGTGVILMFMMMLGIGKLQDLRYLRVVATVYVASAAAALMYGLLITFVPGDYFGLCTKLSLPFSWGMGVMMKRSLDRRFNRSDEETPS